MKVHKKRPDLICSQSKSGEIIAVRKIVKLTTLFVKSDKGPTRAPLNAILIGSNMQKRQTSSEGGGFNGQLNGKLRFNWA